MPTENSPGALLLVHTRHSKGEWGRGVKATLVIRTLIFKRDHLGKFQSQKQMKQVTKLVSLMATEVVELESMLPKGIY